LQGVTRDEEGDAAIDDHRTFGQRCERLLVVTLGPRRRVDPLGMKPGVDLVRPRWPRVQFAPDLDEPNVVLPPAHRAWPVSRGERGGLVEEEQLREPARLHHRRTVPPPEPKATRDPACAAEAPTDVAGLVVEAPSIAVHEPPRGVSDQLTERGHPVLQRHRRTIPIETEPVCTTNAVDRTRGSCPRCRCPRSSSSLTQDPDASDRNFEAISVRE